MNVFILLHNHVHMKIWILSYSTAASYKSGQRYSYSLSAEVGLLTRNVKVVGEHYDSIQKESFGGRILVGDYFDGHQQWTGWCNCRKRNWVSHGMCFLGVEQVRKFPCWVRSDPAQLKCSSTEWIYTNLNIKITKKNIIISWSGHKISHKNILSGSFVSSYASF